MKVKMKVRVGYNLWIELEYDIAHRSLRIVDMVYRPEISPPSYNEVVERIAEEIVEGLGVSKQEARKGLEEYDYVIEKFLDPSFMAKVVNRLSKLKNSELK